MKLTLEQYLAISVPVLKICSELADSPRIDIPELAKIHQITNIITSLKPDISPQQLSKPNTKHKKDERKISNTQ